MQALRAIRPTTRVQAVQLAVLLLGWALATAVLLYGAWALQYTTTNIDGFSYIRIAELYAAGNWQEAINAFWSPFLSWAMLPFMAAGVTSDAAIWAASATWSAIGILVAVLFTWRWSGRSFVGSLLVGTTLTACLVGELMQEGPDLIVVTWTVVFLAVLAETNEILIEGSARSRVLWGIVLGIVLALGYYVKAYDVPVFLVVGFGWVVIRLVVVLRAAPKKERGPLVRRLLVAPFLSVAVCAALIAPFATALSVKYGYPTAGTSFAVNMQGKFGDAESDDYTLLLAAPPGPNAISFGDDRTLQLAYNAQLTAGTPSESLLEKAKYYVRERVVAFPFYLSRIGVSSPFAVLIGAAFLLLLAFRRIDPVKHRAVVLAEAVLVVYFLGYAAITSESSGGGNIRYHLPMLALSTIMAGVLWPTVWRRVRELGSWWRPAIAVALVALIPLAAVAQHDLAFPYPFSKTGTQVSVGYLRKAPVESKTQQFAEQLLADGILAPHAKIFASNGMYIRTLEYAFYARVQVYGRKSYRNIEDPAFQKVLAAAGIDYYFLYEPSGSVGMDTSDLGTVAGRFTMPYTCGDVDGNPGGACRLTIVRLDLPAS